MSRRWLSLFLTACLSGGATARNDDSVENDISRGDAGAAEVTPGQQRGEADRAHIGLIDETDVVATVSPYTVWDWPVLQGLVRVANACGAIDARDTAADLERPSEAFDHEDRALWLLRADGRPAGFAAAACDEPGVVEIHRFFTLPDTPRAASEQLLTHALRFARDAGALKVVMPGMLASWQSAVFERMGFQPWRSRMIGDRQFTEHLTNLYVRLPERNGRATARRALAYQ